MMMDPNDDALRCILQLFSQQAKLERQIRETSGLVKPMRYNLSDELFL